jgi:GT2 family glycosyltransferase
MPKNTAKADIDLSLCIINHRTPGLLARCLRSIAVSEAAGALEVLVVNNTGDNADEIAEMVHRFPSGLFIQNRQPLGFAANQNQMLRRARGRYWMPLNSDAEVTPGALSELIHFMDTHPDCALAGPRLVYPDGRLQPSMRNFPSALTHFLEASGLWRVAPRSEKIGRHYALLSPHKRVQAVDWLTGACLIVRPVAAERVGLYDEVNFPGMYGEDLEWCWRMRQAGWRIYLDPAAVIIHDESASPLDERTVRMFEGFYTFCRLHYSRRQCRAIRAATIAALAPRLLTTPMRAHRQLYLRLMQLPIGGGSPL